MKHLTTYLIELGYEPYRYSCIYPSQNADAKSQNTYILNNKDKYSVEITEHVSKDEITFYFKSTQPYYDFSTMRVGGNTTVWVKNKDFKNPIIWGLNEQGKPPTLISPRPNIKALRKNSKGMVVKMNELRDDAMNTCLSKETAEDIFEAMFDNTKIFDYE